MGLGERLRAARVLLGERRRASLSQRGAIFVLATCPSSQRQFFFYPSSLLPKYIHYATFNSFALLLRYTVYNYKQEDEAE